MMDGALNRVKIRMLIDYPIIARNVTYKAGFKKIIENISVVLQKNDIIRALF